MNLSVQSTVRGIEPALALSSDYSQVFHLADDRISFRDAGRLFGQIRASLSSPSHRTFKTDVAPPIDACAGAQLFLTVFQPGLKSVRWGTRIDSLPASINRILKEIRPKVASFDISDPGKSRILFEFTTSSDPLPNLKVLQDGSLKSRRFEPGVTGLAFRFGDKHFFYMPTEAFTRSHMTLQHALEYLTQRVGLKNEDRIVVLKEKATHVRRLTSRAFVSFGAEVIELYRGYPTTVSASRAAIQSSFDASVEWLLRHQKPTGKFLYHYDAATDSVADFQHPQNPNYYNMLRHGGGIITLLRAYEISPNERLVAAARRAIEFCLQKSVSYSTGTQCRYVMDNGKAKLGGTGVNLVALMHYYRLTGDDSFLSQSHEMANHLENQVDKDGEFLGYYIHPLFNDGKPLTNVSDKDKRKLFSFYYPGEALLGLALYEKYAPVSEARRAEIRQIGRKALDFLMYDRPKKYSDLFLSLPADSWLMQAIEEWSSNPEMRHPDYSAFVYGDAKKMIEHMYQPHNSLYPDYVGQFFYDYGEHAIPDGSRAEGLIAAYYLARLEGEMRLEEMFMRYCKMAAQGLMHTYNSAESMYAAKAPEKACGAFRFKLTRQWMRVDSVQHTACFFARLLPIFDESH